MANKRTLPQGQGNDNPLTNRQVVDTLVSMADTTTNTKARGGQLKAKPMTFYPYSPEFRAKVEALADVKGRTASNFICFMIDEFFKTDPDAIAYVAERQTTAA